MIIAGRDSDKDIEVTGQPIQTEIIPDPRSSVGFDAGLAFSPQRAFTRSNL